MTKTLDGLMDQISQAKLIDEDVCLDRLIAGANISPELRTTIVSQATRLVHEVRDTSSPVRMDALLAEYGLGSREGVALLRLAEALFRVPDGPTQDRLIADKLVGPDWKKHRGKSPSGFVNLTTLALQLTSSLLQYTSKPGKFRKIVRPAVQYPIRIATRKAVNMLSGRFVHGRTIEESIAAAKPNKNDEIHFSFDMLGEAALTAADAERFFDDYTHAIKALQPKCMHSDFRRNPGISVKLSALHPRYELNKTDRVISELGNRLFDLSLKAKQANMGLNIDAEEADRLELSLMVIEQVLRREELSGWDGFGVVVQAYGKAAPHVIDWLYELVCDLDRRIMIRLVKGAYWDTEIKRAQLEGLSDFPVYTRKAATDVAYLCCALKLLGMTDRIYPQIAGHNAHTVASILEFASDDHEFEFQRIHGMGEQLHNNLLDRHERICRIYAPVGKTRELLPYLARRILENGANSSFVNQIADLSVKPGDIANDPFTLLDEARKKNWRPIDNPSRLFGDERTNSMGWDIHHPETVVTIEKARQPFADHTWNIPHAGSPSDSMKTVYSPVNPDDVIGQFPVANPDDVDAAYEKAETWHSSASASERSGILVRASELLEEDAGEMFALMAREAGKTLDDAIAELREAVDFLRYYAVECLQHEDRDPVGIVVCISPWNFPLAIFVGQCSAALAAGNAVLAKPAGQTPLLAHAVVSRLHRAGVPENALQLLPGPGRTVGERLISHPEIAGIAFTGSTETAQHINRSMAGSRMPSPRLVAETGGLNAMIVDSTALPEQAIQDIIDSAFRSAGQRCSALRMLYLQMEIADSFLEMLYGAMNELEIGDPWKIETDIGPLIDKHSANEIAANIDAARADGRLLYQLPAPDGNFVGPAVIRVNGIEDLESEIFGPVLHVARFSSYQIDHLVKNINTTGYGLTFGVHTRIDTRATELANAVAAGNIYVNRNQIGAVVGSQPFGGEGLSGTGPKAGGPEYIKAFLKPRGGAVEPVESNEDNLLSFEEVQAKLYCLGSRRDVVGKPVEMPGPTGESNRLVHLARGNVLCLGPGAEYARAQSEIARQHGCKFMIVAEDVNGENALSGTLKRSDLARLHNFDLVALWGTESDIREARKALASRDGPIIPLSTGNDMADLCCMERHVCVDTTAAGGNAALYASMGKG